MSEKIFVEYEYTSVTVRQAMESIYADGYANFGWKLESTSIQLSGESMVMKFKRDCKIRNKVELIRLQRKFDFYVEEIESLENPKAIKASIVLGYLVQHLCQVLYFLLLISYQFGQPVSLLELLDLSAGLFLIFVLQESVVKQTHILHR